MKKNKKTIKCRNCGISAFIVDGPATVKMKRGAAVLCSVCISKLDKLAAGKKFEELSKGSYSTDPFKFFDWGCP